MTMTKHAYARFKQRQKVKNRSEMMRKFALALERGTLLIGETNRPGTLCYEFDGYKYIVTDDKESLITVISSKKYSTIKKNRLIAELRMKQYLYDAKSRRNAL